MPNPAALVKACADPLDLHRQRRESPVLPVDCFATMTNRHGKPRRDSYCAYKAQLCRARYRADPDYRRRRLADNYRWQKITRDQDRRADQRFRTEWVRRFLVDLRGRGWAQERIAAAAGLGKDTIGELLRHQRQPRPKTFQALWALSLDLVWEQGREGGA
jgi:hypothetical protein